MEHFKFLFMVCCCAFLSEYCIRVDEVDEGNYMK